LTHGRGESRRKVTALSPARNMTKKRTFCDARRASVEHKNFKILNILLSKSKSAPGSVGFERSGRRCGLRNKMSAGNARSLSCAAILGLESSG